MRVRQRAERRGPSFETGQIDVKRAGPAHLATVPCLGRATAVLASLFFPDVHVLLVDSPSYANLAANRTRIPDGLYRIDTFYVLLPAYWSSRRRRSGMSGRQVAPLTEEAGTIDHLVMGDAPKARSQRFPPIRTAVI